MAPPDPIPNSAVKHVSGDGSVGIPHVRVAHRQAPHSKTKNPAHAGFFVLRSSIFRCYFNGNPTHRVKSGLQGLHQLSENNPSLVQPPVSPSLASRSGCCECLRTFGQPTPPCESSTLSLAGYGAPHSKKNCFSARTIRKGGPFLCLLFTNYIRCIWLLRIALLLRKALACSPHRKPNPSDI